MEDASLLMGLCHFSLPGGHPGSFTCGLELTPGLSLSSEAATRLDLMSLHSFSKPSYSTQGCGVVPTLSVFAKEKKSLKCFDIKNFLKYLMICPFTQELKFYVEEIWFGDLSGL